MAMMRWGPPKRLIIFALAAAIAASCSQKTAVVAQYAADQCNRVTLIDAATGKLIRGAEDLALDPAHDRVYVSAYNRRSVELAVRRNAPKIPEGGVYTVSLSKLIEGPGKVVAAPFVNADDIAGGLRPHGISYNSRIGELAFINRGYQRVGGLWRMTPQIERVGVHGEVIVNGNEKTPCAANDLVDEPGHALISYDHERCDWRAGLEDAFSLHRSGVAADDGERLFDRGLYANGIARLKDGEIALAVTREKALLLMDESAAGLKPTRRIPLPGGPDNLTVSSNGDIIAAVHPSLLLMALDRRLDLGAAPSRIVSVNPRTGDVKTLFDDPAGALFSAATVAAQWNGALIAGSVIDDGLLVCEGGR